MKPLKKKTAPLDLITLPYDFNDAHLLEKAEFQEFCRTTLEADESINLIFAVEEVKVIKKASP